jgi:hypothetical protein
MDPIYNEPMPIKTGGREFVVRELPARLVRGYMQQYFRVSIDSLNQGITGADLMAFMKDPNAADKLLSIVDPALLMTNYWDLSVQVIADAVSEDVSTVSELPIGALMDLADEVLKIHGRYVTRFFQMRSGVVVLIEAAQKKNGGMPGPSSRLDTSPDLSGPGSITEPSAT